MSTESGVKVLWCACAAAFASDQCPEGFVAVSKSTLRIITVENVGDTFNQSSVKLQYTPRKFVVHEGSKLLYVVEADNQCIPEMEKPEVKKEESSPMENGQVNMEYAAASWNMHCQWSCGSCSTLCSGWAPMTVTWTLCHVLFLLLFASCPFNDINLSIFINEGRHSCTVSEGNEASYISTKSGKRMHVFTVLHCGHALMTYGGCQSGHLPIYMLCIFNGSCLNALPCTFTYPPHFLTSWATHCLRTVPSLNSEEEPIVIFQRCEVNLNYGF